MSQMIVRPMPDEPAVAHAGRLALFLGTASQKHFDQWLRKEAESSAAVSATAPRLEQLAAVVGMAPQSYAQQHSMLGVMRVAAKPNVLSPHGAPSGKTFSRRLGMLIQKPQAHICPKCVEEDLKHWQFSWYRRSHQLSGVDACLVHKTPLLQVRSSTAWTQLPQHWLEQGDVQDGPHDAHWRPTAFETRLGEVACAMLQRAEPYSSGPFVDALSARARHLGLRTSMNGVKSNLSEWVWKVAPAEWTALHWPELAKKTKGEFFFGLDSVPNSRTVPSSGFAYLTALTALWETSDEVLQTLAVLGQIPADHEKPLGKRVNVRGQKYWHGAVWETYLKNQGRVRAMAPELGVDPTYLREKLNQLGLPPLHDVGNSPCWRAYLRFESGETLRDACEAEGVTVGELEPLIRTSCARVATAAKHVLKSVVQVPRSHECMAPVTVSVNQPVDDNPPIGECPTSQPSNLVA